MVYLVFVDINFGFRLARLHGVFLRTTHFSFSATKYTQQKHNITMKFRPCIDLHHGQVKQIVGSTLSSEAAEAPTSNDGSTTTTTTTTPATTTTKTELATNFSTTKPAADFAHMYQNDHLTGGHVIMLGPGNTEAAIGALKAWPAGLQVGGGITDETAEYWLAQGASHVIVTSHVFRDGQICVDRLQTLVDKIGKERLVLDLSCRRKPSDPEGQYYVVTDKWQKFTDYPVNQETLQTLGSYCDEFLVHGVDVEGKQCGILEDLVVLLGQYSPVPVTYAGGVRSLQDLDHVQDLGQGKVDCTVGSALDIFGGSLPYEQVVVWHKERNPDVPSSK
jgi:phosphoribosylformimino-5-aminoimidazole carboxamide ribotide isomerase